MRTLRGIIAILLIQLVVAACDKALPVAPTQSPSPPAPAPTVPAITGEKWNLTTTITSLAGPAECVRDPAAKLPVASDWLLTVERAGDSLRLVASGVLDPGDSYEYFAKVAGAEFSGRGASESGYFVCGETRSYRGADYLEGRFSADLNTLTADEELVLQLSSGDVITYQIEWSATKQ